MNRTHIKVRMWQLVTLLALAVEPARVTAQEPQPATPETREAVIEQAQAEKVNDLHPYVLGESERLMNKAEGILANGLTSRPFVESAYQGAAFRLVSATGGT